MAIFLHKPILGNFTIVGPLIWCDNPQVRLWMISNINNNDFHHLGKSQICAGADHYFSPSKAHSGKLCIVIHNIPSMMVTQGDDNMWGEHSWAQQAAWERSLVMEDRVDRVSLDSAWFITGQPGPSLDTCSSVFSIMSQLEGGGTAPLDNEHLRSLDTGGIHGQGTRISTLS